MRPASFISSFKQVISVLVLLALVLTGVLFWSRALAIGDGPEKNGAFLRDDRQYDVLFFGSSHVVNGIYPMELWRDYGITAYNLGGHGASIAASYWEMRLAVEQHKPKVAVLDVLFAGSDYTWMEIGLAHELFDPYPLSRLKIQAVTDIFEEKGDRMELLFPLDVYHNRWKDLDTEMVRRGLEGFTDLSPEKGAQTRVEVYPLDRANLLPASDCMEGSSAALGYVEKFVTYCLENGITPVLTYLPCQIPEEWQRACNAALRLGQQLGAEILDMQYLDIPDDSIDWYDDGSHLNPSGALKTTACMGSFLQDRLGLGDHRQDSAYSAWHDDYAAYAARQKETMKNLSTAPQILSLSALELFTVEASVSEDFSDPTVLRQLESLGVTPTVRQDGPALELTVRDSAGTVLIQKSFAEETVLRALVDSSVSP